MKRRSFFWLTLAPLLVALRLKAPKQERATFPLPAVDFDGAKDHMERDRNQPDFSNAEIAPARYIDLSIEANRRMLLKGMQ